MVEVRLAEQFVRILACWRTLCVRASRLFGGDVDPAAPPPRSSHINPSAGGESGMQFCAGRSVARFTPGLVAVGHARVVRDFVTVRCAL